VSWASRGRVSDSSITNLPSRYYYSNSNNKTDNTPGIYSASKASINLLGSTLRLELEPLGVKVITEITGIVRSNFFANQPPFILPSNSMYQFLEGSIANVAKGEDLPPSVMSAGEYAERLVKKVLGGKTGNTYTGSLAWSVKWVPFFPGWILVSLNAGNRGEELMLIMCAGLVFEKTWRFELEAGGNF
jgi:hypothetical protein